MQKLFSVFIVLLMVTITGCSSKPKETQPTIIVDFTDMQKDLDAMPDLKDMKVDLSDMKVDANSCKARGLASTPFDASGGFAMGGLAGDFGVETREGTWQLSTQWSGCDSYVFLNYHNSTQGKALWNTASLTSLFVNAPKNTHFFFGAYADTAQNVEPHLQSIEAKVNEVFRLLGPSVKGYWAPRVHYVTKPIQSASGSLGILMRSSLSTLFGFGVDRLQRFDNLGSLANIGRAGFVPDLNMAAFAPHYYNHQFELAQKLNTEQDVTEVVLFDEQLVTENNKLYDATFPDPQTMAKFNEMEIEVQARCGPNPQDCGEWDYESFIELCRDETCDERDQIVLWITPYSRPGTRRWVADASPFLGLLKQGGVQKFRYGMLWNMNPNHMTVRFRLKTKPDVLTPVSTIPAFEGGEFNATYNEGRQPLRFTPPQGIKKVELVALITGHGQTEGNNCAEWCNHQHLFTINSSAPILKDYPNQAGQPLACAKLSAQGVVPGQYGNWTPGRAAWCPGQIVQPWRMDVTERVKIGEENTLVYEGRFNDGLPQGGRIRMSSYLVYYQ